MASESKNGESSPLRCEVVYSKDVLSQAKGLVLLQYQNSGVAGSKLPHNRMDDDLCTTFVVYNKKAMWATVSMVKDSHLGLPMDCMYSQEIDVIRKTADLVAEMTCFANIGSKGVRTILMLLFSNVYHHAIKNNVSDLVMAANPDHVGIYKMLGAKVVGGQKKYEIAQGKPAVALHIPLDEAWHYLKNNHSRKFKTLFRSES